MPNWKKVIVSGSSAHLNQITSSADINVSGNSLLDFNYSAQTVQGNVTASSAAHTIVVTVISKTSSHPYINLGSSSGYSLDGIESPWLNLTEGIYKFDVSHSSVGSHPFRFYFDAARTQQYTDNVSTETGAVYLTVNKDTPQVLYYQCSSHGYMGFGLSTSMNPLVQDENGLKTLVSASAQITHDDTTGFVANEHIDHSGVSISTGTGLTGGGDITTTRTLSVDFSDSTLQTTISGSFTEASSSISTRLTVAESELGNTLISSSAQLGSDISGSWRGELSSSVYLQQVATTISGSITSTSSSIASDIASNLSSINTNTTNINTLTSKTGSYATTGSNHFKANQTISGSLTVTDTIIAQEFKTEFVSASITFTSGSTKFGDSTDDVHNMTGSLRITGSFQVDNGTSTVNALTAESVTISGDISGSSTSTGSFGIVQSTGLTANESVIVASDGKSLTSSDLISYDTVNSRVGIGTTSPSVKLDIVGESSGETQVRMGQHSDDSDAPDVRLFKSRGSVSSPTAVNNLDNLAFFNSFAYNGSAYVQAGAFGWQADGTDGDSRFIINTRIGNSVATRLLINPVGDVVLTHNISGSSASTGSFGRVEATKFAGDGSELTGVGSSITVKDEGSDLTTSATSINFVGTGVSAVASGNDVTATIAGADLINVFENDSNGDLQPSDSNQGISFFYEYDDNNDITLKA